MFCVNICTKRSWDVSSVSLLRRLAVQLPRQDLPGRGFRPVILGPGGYLSRADRDEAVQAAGLARVRFVPLPVRPGMVLHLFEREHGDEMTCGR